MNIGINGSANLNIQTLGPYTFSLGVDGILHLSIMGLQVGNYTYAATYPAQGNYASSTQTIPGAIRPVLIENTKAR